jgi:muconolactone delta-isomerase
MKYLILAKQREGATPPANLIAVFEAAKEVLNKGLADGSVDCAYQFADGRRGVSIVNAESAEALWEMLDSYPFYSVQDYEVHPLADVNYVVDKAIKRMKQAAGG